MATPISANTANTANANTGDRRAGDGSRMIRTPSPSVLDGVVSSWPLPIIGLDQAIADQGAGGL